MANCVQSSDGVWSSTSAEDPCGLFCWQPDAGDYKLDDGTILKKRFCLQTYGVATAIALVALALSSRCWVRVLFTVISNILQSGRRGYERSRRSTQIRYHFPHLLGLLDDSHHSAFRSADLEERAESRRLRRLNNNRAPTEAGGAFGDFTLKDLSFAGCVAATCSAGFIWALTWVSISQIPPPRMGSGSRQLNHGSHVLGNYLDCDQNAH